MPLLPMNGALSVSGESAENITIATGSYWGNLAHELTAIVELKSHQQPKAFVAAVEPPFWTACTVRLLLAAILELRNPLIESFPVSAFRRRGSYLSQSLCNASTPEGSRYNQFWLHSNAFLPRRA